MSKITKGSTKAVTPSIPSSCSSNNANTYERYQRHIAKLSKFVINQRQSIKPNCIRELTKEMIAASNKILTNKSSNCSRTSCHKVFPSSTGNSGSIQNFSYIIIVSQNCCNCDDLPFMVLLIRLAVAAYLSFYF